MDRKTLLAILLTFGIFFGWQKLYLEPRTARQQQVQTQQPQQAAPQASAPQAAAPTQIQPQTVPVKPGESKELTTSIGTARITSGPELFQSWDIKGFQARKADKDAAVNLQALTHQQGVGQVAFDLSEYAYLNQVQGTLSTTPQGMQWVYEDANVKMVRDIRPVEGKPYAMVQLTAEFKAKRPGYMFVSLTAHSPEGDEEERDRQFLYWTNKSVEREAVYDIDSLKEVSTPLKWAGVESRYFMMAMIPQGGVEPRGLIQQTGTRTARMSMVFPITGNSITVPMKVYYGPKDLDVLRAVDPSLDNAVDFGWFTIIAYPLLKIMKWFNGMVHNYGVAIILLTILVNILTFPLTYKSMKSMREMARLQPQLQRIREKYKDDKEALNREMLTMMKSHGYNPMAGCLPILIQMPIFFALYRVLYSAIELYNAPFMLWIQDLSSKDPFYVTPILLAGVMYVQQKMTPTPATDPVQAKMMQFMPLIFGLFMLTLPSGLTVYMLVNALVGIIRQAFFNKKLGYGPVTTNAA